MRAPLPRDVQRLDRVLREELDRNLLNATGVVLFDLPAQHAEPAEIHQTGMSAEVREVVAVQDEISVEMNRNAADDVEVANDIRVDEAAQTALTALMLLVSESGVVTEDTVSRLEAMVRAGREWRSASEKLLDRINALENVVDDLRAAEVEALRTLEDEQLERAAAEEARAEAERQLRHMRLRMAAEGQHELAYEQVPGPEGVEVPPESFADLLARFDELDGLVFTGDERHAFELDEKNPLGTWAAKTWEALLALSDYVGASADGRCSSGVHGYLGNTPDGCHGFSQNRHGQKESADVEKNPKFRRPRTLPVPVEVDPSGTAYMDAHFKITQSGLVSPRMHYLDDTTRTGKIYVGYIGRHLPTQKTN